MKINFRPILALLAIYLCGCPQNVPIEKCESDQDCLEYDDGDACSGIWKCLVDQCAFSQDSVVECDTSQDTHCVENVCDPDNGQCIMTARNESQKCAEDDSCGTNYACIQGECVGDPTTPDTPNPLLPANGAYSGSPHAAVSHNTLRPRFKWGVHPSQLCDGTRYELQLDDSCNSADFDNCQFYTPELNRSDVTQLTWRPEIDLPAVVDSAPVGTRYYWRIRACRGISCSAWSVVRYFNLGRVPMDFDGDGHSDVLIGAAKLWSNADSGAFVYYGKLGGVSSSPDLTLAEESVPLGYAVAGCDVNSDGFADLILGTSSSVRIYRGTQSGVSGSYTALTTPSGFSQFGATLACLGDLNMDGYEDFAVGGVWFDGSGQGKVAVYNGNSIVSQIGNPTILVNTTDPSGYTEFGISIASAGDLNGDGASEFVVGASFQKVESVYNQGRAFLYYGGKQGIPTTPDLVMENPIPEGSFFGDRVSSAGDLNGDGYAELAISSPRHSELNQGAVFVFPGNPEGVMTESVYTLSNPQAQGGQFGSGVATSNLNGDEYANLFVGARTQNAGATSEGNLFVFDGSSEGIIADPSFVLDSPDNHVSGLFGNVVGAAGDVNGDGFPDLVVGTSYDTAFVVYGRADQLIIDASSTLVSPDVSEYYDFSRNVGCAVW